MAQQVARRPLIIQALDETGQWAFAIRRDGAGHHLDASRLSRFEQYGDRGFTLPPQHAVDPAFGMIQ